MTHRANLMHEAVSISTWLLALNLCACGGGGSEGSGGSSQGGSGGNQGSGGVGQGSGGSSGLCMGTNVTANEANNYSFSSTLTFPPVQVAPMSDLQFDWGAVTADFLGHAVDPRKDLNTLLVFVWDLSLDDLQTKLNADALASRDLTVVPPLSHTTDGNSTSARMLEFTFSGGPIGEGGMVTADQVLSFFDPSAYDPATHTYTLMAATGDVLGQGTRMVQSFLVDATSTNTTVTMTKDSTHLEFQADLTSLAPTTIPAGQPNVSVDWSMMTTNALGGDFTGTSATKITSAFIGHYEESPSELSGDKFLDLELIATTLFRKSVDTGTSADLSTFVDGDGNSFAGIDNDGTWLLGLQCGECRNPAPWYIAVLKPCG
ncbi:MAG: hypothetical protein JW940_26955 [Polyangiaceae bacterium]|nr:hypothetical protein [Polyangiaceae bacterium]